MDTRQEHGVGIGVDVLVGDVRIGLGAEEQQGGVDDSHRLAILLDHLAQREQRGLAGLVLSIETNKVAYNGVSDATPSVWYPWKARSSRARWSSSNFCCSG